MALLIYPKLWLPMTNAPILEEVALDLDGAIRAHGFQRIAHTVSGWGMLNEIFTNGLPSRAAVQVMKQTMLRAAEGFQRKQARENAP